MFPEGQARYLEEKWKIEYGLLVSAHGLSRDNPEFLEEAVKKSKNKKEFMMTAGIG